MHKVHIAIWEFQATALMFHRMAFHSSGNQGGTVSLFLSRLAHHILNLTDKQGITLIPAYIPIHLNVKTDYLSWGKLVPECFLLPVNA